MELVFINQQESSPPSESLAGGASPLPQRNNVLQLATVDKQSPRADLSWHSTTASAPKRKMEKQKPKTMTMTMSMRKPATIAHQDEVIGFDGTCMQSAGLECITSFGSDLCHASSFETALQQILLYWSDGLPVLKSS